MMKEELNYNEKITNEYDRLAMKIQEMVYSWIWRGYRWGYSDVCVFGGNGEDFGASGTDFTYNSRRKDK